MHRQSVSPTCGEADDLTGTRGTDGTAVTCERPGTARPRDAAEATCAGPSWSTGRRP